MTVQNFNLSSGVAYRGATTQSLETEQVHTSAAENAAKHHKEGSEVSAQFGAFAINPLASSHAPVYIVKNQTAVGAPMNKKTNKTTTRKQQLKQVMEAKREVSVEKNDGQKTLLTKHNRSLSETQDALADVTDEDELFAKQQQQHAEHPSQLH